jgi:Uma2 family endonuclease
MRMPAIRRRWTPEAVRSLNEATASWPRYELIDGELLVTPSPGLPHQIAITELLLLVAPYVDREGLGITITAPSDVELQEGSITQPDMYVLPAGPEAEEKGVSWAPGRQLALAVEVLSLGSLRTDRVIKRDFYIENGVAEYWIVDLDARILERWVPSHDTPQVERYEAAWQSEESASALIIDLTSYFDRVEKHARWARKAMER